MSKKPGHEAAHGGRRHYPAGHDPHSSAYTSFTSLSHMSKITGHQALHTQIGVTKI